jgi:aspartate/methionine/tyrosine aminotransferase
MTLFAQDIPFPLLFGFDLHLDIGAVKGHFSDPRTKVFVPNNPANPTSMVESSKIVKTIFEFVADSGITAINDEVYEKLCYWNAKFVNAVIFGDNVITINVTGKRYSMIGWNILFFAASEEVIREFVNMQQYTLAYPNSIAKYAAMGVEYEACRDTLIAIFREMKISVNRPSGAFYAFPQMGVHALRKIMDAGVIIAQGIGFGSACVGHVWMNYTILEENIKKAVVRMTKVFG